MSIGRVMSTTNSPNTNLPSAHNRHNALPNIVVLMDLSVISARQSGHLPVVARIRSKHAAQQRVVESRRSQHVNRRFLSGTASRQMQHTLAGIDMSMARSLHSQLAACVCAARSRSRKDRAMACCSMKLSEKDHKFLNTVSSKGHNRIDR